jgi:hypothetical protein
MGALGRLVNRIAGNKQRKLSDEYLTWLGFANAGMLHAGNPWLIQYAVENLPSRHPIVEIGSFCGLSTNVISYFVKKAGKQNPLFTCDRWIFEGSAGGGQIGNGIAHAAYREFVKSSFLRNVEFFGAGTRPSTIEVFSDEFFERWRKQETVEDVFGGAVDLGGPISFCYVDGNHTYEFAKRDFTNADEFLDSGGFILFDDSWDGNHFGLTPLMNEIARNPRYELIAKNPNYLFRKRA